MMKRVKVAPLEMSPDRFSYKLLCLTDRLFQRQAGRKTSRDRRRIRATGAMSCDPVNERR